MTGSRLSVNKRPPSLNDHGGGKTYEMTCVSMGNPHCVIFCEEDVRSLDLEKIGPSFERHERFPKRINTEFVNVLG